MLNALCKYENLGTPLYFFELFKQLKSHGNFWNTEDIQEYFFNRIIDGKRLFDWCIPLLTHIQVISVDDSGRLTVIDSWFEFVSENVSYLQWIILERLFVQLKENELFHEIFSPCNISYDVIYNTIQINNSCFKFRYANFKQLLIDFHFFAPHPDYKDKLVVNGKYKKLFDRHILPSIKAKKIGIVELQKSLEQKQIHWEEAEIFVLKYEKLRLHWHLDLNQIKKISDYDVGAGYDIASFNGISSFLNDRFIEVKSYVWKPNFYWSRNEIEVSRIRKDSYFLYLVDRDLINDPAYDPLIIQNPYESVLKNDNGWNKDVDKYFVYQSIAI